MLLKKTITKSCTKCGIEKESSQFYKSKGGKFGTTSFCIECYKLIHKLWREKNKEKLRKKQKIYYENHKKELYCYRMINKKKRRIYDKNYGKEKRSHKRNMWLLKTYQIDSLSYYRLLKQQNEVCAICGKKEIIFDKRNNKFRSLAIDHNHKTGKIRGLLCSKCNRGLGLFDDNIQLLKNVIIYLSTKGTQNE